MAEGSMGAPDAGKSERIVIKKYANRRLYNTASSTYVTLDHLAELVREGRDFVVFDAKTNDDITRQVLTQIIFEEEQHGQNLLPIQFLRQLIRLYGDQMQGFVPGYLEMSLDAFARQQEQLRQQITEVMGGAAGGAKAVNPAMALFEEQVRGNLGLFQQAMKAFTPFAFPTAAAPPAAPATPPPAPAAAAPASDDLTELKARMAEMQVQLEKLAKKKG